jgi:hypothetical protein
MTKEEGATGLSQGFQPLVGRAVGCALKVAPERTLLGVLASQLD